MGIRAERFDKFLSDSPKFHCWDGKWQVGHTERFFRYLFDLLLSEFGDKEFQSIETGAGSTTIVFLAAGPTQHTSVLLESEVQGRIVEYLTGTEIPIEPYRALVGRSEELLPPIALAEEASVDVAMIDGGHGWPTVFVDFCYCNYMLKKGGVLIVDDLQLYSVQQLYLLLRAQPEWELVQKEGKWAVLRKLSDAKFERGPKGQPFIMGNSVLANH